VSLYLCSQEPKQQWRSGHIIVVKVVEANSRAAALRQFSDARDDQDGNGKAGYSARYFKAPQAVPLQINVEYRL
jgi:hypothetical protein